MNGRPPGPPPIASPDSEWSGFSNYHDAGPRPQSPGFPPQSRGNMMTPPASGSSNGVQPRMSSGMPGRPTGPSPPNSINARSSYGTTMSSSDARRRQTMQMEDRLSQHYAVLKRYLGPSLRDEKSMAKQNRARDKLLRLSSVQFQELSTDVYDELLRRQSAQGQQLNGPGQVPQYLLPRDNFHPKRNQARQKLSTLPPPRFRDLATDVFFELERRFPHFAGRDIPRNGSPLSPPSRVGTPNSMRYGARNQSLSSQAGGHLGGSDDAYGRPTAKQFQSNTIIPNKSTMVEDDDDDGLSDVYASRRDTTYTARSMGGSDKDRKAAAELDSQVNELQNKVRTLEDNLRDKNSELEKTEEREKTVISERDRFTDLQADLEAKLRSARDFNADLQAELDKVRSDHATAERDLRSQMDAITSQAQGSNEWKNRYEALDRTQQELRAELSEQERLTTDIRNETMTYMTQLKQLSQQTSDAFEREEKTVLQLRRAEAELQEWKNRFARVKSESAFEQSPLSKSIQTTNASALISSSGITAPGGLIKAVHVTRFQLAINDLLYKARGEELQAVLPCVKAVILAVRNITLDVGNSALPTAEATDQFNKLKGKISATATNLITATKNYASSQGASPLSLLDAAASHLSSAICAMIRLVKVDQNSVNEREDDVSTDIIDSPMEYYGGGGQGRASVGAESTYSTDSKPRLTSRAFSGSHQKKPVMNGLGNGSVQRQPSPNAGLSDVRIEELKTFLDARTDTLRSTLQALVSSIRTSAPPPDILDAVASITSTTRQIVHQTSSLISPNSRPSDTAASLADLVEQLEDKGREGESITSEDMWRDYVNGLPPIGFEIARGVKELGAWVEEELRGDNFS